MSLEIKGKLHEKKDEEKISETFKKRVFVLNYADNPTYPQFPTFELVQDKCSLLDNIQIGQEINVHFNLNGRKYTPVGTDDIKYFNTNQAWKIDTFEVAGNGDDKKEDEKYWKDEKEDDLPF